MRENILVGFTQGQPKYIGCHMFTFIDYKDSQLEHPVNVTLTNSQKNNLNALKQFYWF